MGKPGNRSVLYRLIEVGQLAGRALRETLTPLGLESGDDALLFFLHDYANVTEADLAVALQVSDSTALRRRVARLCDGGFVVRHMTRPDLPSWFELTERGERLRARLAGRWDEIEDALVGELKKKQRKRLRRQLGRFADLLRL